MKVEKSKSFKAAIIVDQPHDYERAFAVHLAPHDVKFYKVTQIGEFEPGTDLVIFDLNTHSEVNFPFIINWCNINPKGIAMVVSAHQALVSRVLSQYQNSIPDNLIDYGTVGDFKIPRWFMRGTERKASVAVISSKCGRCGGKFGTDLSGEEWNATECGVCGKRVCERCQDLCGNRCIDHREVT